VNEDLPIGAASAVVTSDRDIVVERSMYWGGPSGYGTGPRRLGGHNSNGVLTPAPEWYLAEGVSNWLFDEFILLVNPNDQPTTVQIEYLGVDGLKDVDDYLVAPNSRRTVWVRADLDERFRGRFRDRTFSSVVRSKEGLGIIAERSIYWGGLFRVGLDPGGTNAVGLTSTSTVWRFAEGFTGSGFQTFLLMANPHDTQDAEVTVTFFFEDGTTATERRVVRAKSRVNVWVNAEVGRAHEKPFSMLVESTNGVGVVAERAMYWGGLREGHVVTGVRAEAPAWAFAEGMQGRVDEYHYDTYFLLVNTSDADIAVKGTFMLEDGTGVERTFVVGAKSRFTLPAGRVPELHRRRFAAFFAAVVDPAAAAESVAPATFLAERAVYWGPNYQGGHASAGVPWTGAIATPTAVPAPAPEF
jgi:hypothetical protein